MVENKYAAHKILTFLRNSHRITIFDDDVVAKMYRKVLGKSRKAMAQN